MAFLRGSIEKILSLGAKTIHPAHGAAFPADVLKQVIESL